MTDALREAMESGRVRRAEPDHLATLMLNMITGTVTSAVLTRCSSEEFEGLRAELWDFCWRALEAR